MSERKVFTKIRFSGQRFDGGELPLESLKELVELQTILNDLAKEVFYKEHGRQRVPPGFNDALRLKLSALETGSTVPVITEEYALDHPVLEGMPEREKPTTAQECRRQGFEWLLDFIESPSTVQIPRQIKSKLKSFGRSLKEGEGMTLGYEQQRHIYFDQKRRRRILEQQPEPYEELITLSGRVHGLLQDGKTFLLECAHGKELHVSFADEHYTTIMELLRHDQEGRMVPVIVQGVARRKPTGEVEKIIEVSDLQPSYDRPDGHLKRLEMISTLEPGWLDGEGESFEGRVVEWARNVLSRLVAWGVPEPYVYPEEDGIICAEWPIRHWRINVEFTPEMKAIATAIDITKGIVDEGYITEFEMGLSDERLDDMVEFIFTSRLPS